MPGYVETIVVLAFSGAPLAIIGFVIRRLAQNAKNVETLQMRIVKLENRIADR